MVCQVALAVDATENHYVGRISVFRRHDGALLRRFGCKGSGDGELRDPHGLCFMANDRHVAIADSGNRRVSVFSVEDDFVRHVGVGASVLRCPEGVACSAFDELVVTDADRDGYASRVVVFTAGGEVATMLGGRGSDICCAALHDGALFVYCCSCNGSSKCIVFT